MKTVVEGNKITTSFVASTKRMKNYDVRIKSADREMREVIRADADLRTRLKGMFLDPATLVCTELSRTSGSSLYRVEGCYVVVPAHDDEQRDGSTGAKATEGTRLMKTWKTLLSPKKLTEKRMREIAIRELEGLAAKGHVVSDRFAGMTLDRESVDWSEDIGTGMWGEYRFSGRFYTAINSEGGAL